MFDSIMMTPDAKAAIEQACDFTAAWEDSATRTEHLLLALASPEEGLPSQALALRSVRWGEIVALLESREDSTGTSDASSDPVPRFDGSFLKVLELAQEEAKRPESLEYGVVDVEHLLIAVALDQSGLAGRFLTRRGADYAVLRSLLRRLRHEQPAQV